MSRVTEPTPPAADSRAGQTPPPVRPYQGSLDLTTLAALDGKIDSTVLGTETKYDMADLSRLTGWTRDELDQLWLWAGLPAPDPAEMLFNDSDAEGLASLREFRDRENFEGQSLASLIRSIGTTVERLAVWQVESLAKHLGSTRNLGDTAARMEAAAFAPEQTSMLLFLIQKLWMRHYAAAIHRLTTETILRRGVSDDDQQFPLVCGVGFAWIADFLDQTRNYDLPNLGRFVQEFHDQVADIVNANGGRIVNNSGDYVIYVTARPDVGADIALRIAEMHDAGFEGDVKGALVWSRVLSNYGDIFGPGVNLARMLGRVAEPNSVLIDKDTADALSRSGLFDFAPQPEIDFAGIGLVRPVKLTRDTSG